MLALLIFAAYGLLNQHAFSSKPRIEVDSGRIEQITGLFQRTWKRPPTADELKNLIADYVNGEIYYREAQRLADYMTRYEIVIDPAATPTP